MPTRSAALAAAREYVLSLARGQRESYRALPAEVLGDYNHERSVADVYRGRQILELLQNADDAGTGTAGSRRVLFRLTDDHLVVANTGEPFSRRGIRSLIVSNVSPKRLSRARFIGNKGLGFRSVLTWSPAPLVMSGDFLVAFSPDHARQEVAALAGELEELREDLTDWSEKFGYVPAPTMRFPYLPGAADERVRLAEGVRTEGFDTVIVLPLPADGRRAVIRAEILEQLAAIAGETVLFCRHLTEVSVQADADRTWLVERIERDEEQVVAIDNGTERSRWTVIRREGVLPSNLLDEELQETPEFEVAVAVPAHPADGKTHRLCVYFPTDDAVPSALLAHATLATDPSRKRLIRHRANEHILARLAGLLAEVAEREAGPEAPARGLELLAGIEACDRELRDLGFLTALLAACRTRRILPRLDGTLGTAAEVFSPSHTGWLEVATVDLLPEVLDPGISEEARAFAEALDLESYDAGMLATRLEQWVRGTSPAEAGRVVGTLVSTRALRGRASVLVGEGGAPVPFGDTVFLPAERVDVHHLPAWVERFGFLHPEFAEALRGTLGVATLRDTRTRLVESGFKVEEFRLEGVARHLHAEMTEKRHGLPRNEQARLCRELLACLYAMGREESADLSRLGLEVVTTRGSLRRAADCFLGPDYPGGALVHGLYGPIGQDEFAGGPAMLGIAAAPAEVQPFLLRLGAHSGPRRVAFTAPGWSAGGRSFLRAVLEPLQYPNRIFGPEVASWEEAQQLLRVGFQGLFIPERWEQALTCATPEAVIAFLLGDGRRYLDPGPVAGATFTAEQGTQRTHRGFTAVPLPDPGHHLLRVVPWVPCEDGERRTPDRIILSRSGRRVLAGAYVGHALDLNHPVLRGVGGVPAVEGVLHVLGAVHSLDALKPNELYRLLLDLPDRDPKGSDAVKIYRALAETQDLDASSPMRDRFVREGRMWGTKKGVDDYYPVSELRFAPRSALPGPIRGRVPLVAIDPRRGSRSVQRVFGVEPLGRDDFSISLREADTRDRHWSAEAALRLRRSIPYLYAYRLSRTIDDAGRERNALAGCRLRVCETLAVDVTVLGEADAVVLERELEGLVLRSDALLLLVGPESYPDTDPVFWRVVGDLLADLVEVAAAASDFAQLLGCRTDEQRHRFLDLLTDGEAAIRLADATARLQLEEELASAETASPASVPIPVPAPAAPAITAPAPAPGPLPAPQQESAGQVPPVQVSPAPLAAPGSRTEPVPPPDTRTEPPVPVQHRPAFVPTAAPERRAGSRRRFFVTRSARYEPSGPTSQLDEATSLEITSDFERLQGRYPVRVEHIRGYESPGCDIISFAAEADALAVEEHRVADLSLVARFIEVKGRSDRTGVVELEENQRRAAARFQERFYLYRVYRGPSSGEVQLAVLQSPAGSPAETVHTHYSYDLRAGSGAEWYDLTEEIVEA